MMRRNLNLFILYISLFKTVNCLFVVNTWGGPFKLAANNAYIVLKDGGSSLDSVEIGCTTCEVNQCDGSVGYGNHPDTTGRVTLDALIMNGDTMEAGSVAFLSKFRQAAKVARAVMEYTAHTLLVGEGADQFAEMLGMTSQDTNTPESEQIYEDWKNQNCQPNFYRNLEGCDNKCGPYPPPYFTLKNISNNNNNNNNNSKNNKLKSTKTNNHIPWVDTGLHDTIGVVSIDGNGMMSCGTTTNGANHKVRGRVGDSPIIGSGCYVQSEIGGCAATGDGDIMMRFNPSYAAVMYMNLLNLSPRDAAVKALQPIAKYFPTFSGGIVCLTSNQTYGGATYNMNFQISVMGDGMSEVQEVNIEPI